MFTLPRAFAEGMIAQARAEAPNECCGILAGRQGRVERLRCAVNAEASPVRYSIAPAELLEIFHELDSFDQELLAIYHSHTHSQAYPSQTDLKLAFYPDSYHLIISLEKTEQPVIRAFRIVDGQVSEEELVVADS